MKRLSVLFALLVFSTSITFPVASFAIDLTVESTPEGLPLKLDGSSAGQTPRTINLSSDQHILELSHQSNRWKGTIKLNGDAELTASLSGKATEPPYSGLVLSQPADARVKINGKYRGRTPWSGELSAKTHDIQLMKKGHSTWKASLKPSSDFSLRGLLTATEESRGPGDAKHPEEKSNDKIIIDVTDDEKSISMSAQGQVRKVMPVGSTGPVVRDVDNKNESTEKVESDTGTVTDENKVDTRIQKRRDNREDTDTPDVSNDQNEDEKSESTEKIELKIYSEPSEATVIVEDKNLGTTPVVRDEFSADTTTITLKKPGYKKWSSRYYLTGSTTIKVKLKPLRSKTAGSENSED